MSASAGRVLLISKGTWVAGTAYQTMDYVLHKGSTYVCKSNVAGSTEPQNDSSHWQLLASGSEVVSNRNLLDNSWFTVNQREAASYSGSGYTVDRWRAQSSYTNITVKAYGGIEIFASAGGEAYLRQMFRIDKKRSLLGKTVTFSILVGSTVLKCTGTVPSSVPESETEIASATNTGSRESFDYAIFIRITPTIFYVQIRQNSTSAVNITAAKLELGSLSTIANDTAPDYAEELLKCKESFVRMRVAGGRVVGNGYAINQTTVRLSVPIDVTMRDTPTINTSGSGNYTITALSGNASNKPLSLLSVLGAVGPNVTIVYTDPEANFTYNERVTMVGGSEATYIELSAEMT